MGKRVLMDPIPMNQPASVLVKQQGVPWYVRTEGSVPDVPSHVSRITQSLRANRCQTACWSYNRFCRCTAWPECRRTWSNATSNESLTQTAYRLETSSARSGCRRGRPISIGNLHSSPNPWIHEHSTGKPSLPVEANRPSHPYVRRRTLPASLTVFY